MDRNGQRFGQFPVAKNLDLNAPTLNQPLGAQNSFVNACPGGEDVQITHVHYDDFDGKWISETSLRQPALDRRLATLKVLLSDIAGAPSLLALLAATRSLPQARTDTSTEALGSSL
jgi:hypothetical protein